MWSIIVFHAHVLTTDIYFVASVDADNNSTSTMADEDKKKGLAGLTWHLKKKGSVKKRRWLDWINLALDDKKEHKKGGHR